MGFRWLRGILNGIFKTEWYKTQSHKQVYLKNKYKNQSTTRSLTFGLIMMIGLVGLKRRLERQYSESVAPR